MTKLTKRTKHVPEFCRLELHTFVVSPSTGLTGKVTVGGRLGLDMTMTDFDGLKVAACATLNDTADVTDARVMTADEVKAYLEDEDE